MTLMTYPRVILLIALLILTGCSKPQSPATEQREAVQSHVVTDAERAAWPKTVNEAVTNILATMSDEDKIRVGDTPKNELILFHHGWGTGIRNDFGLWRGNTNLMADCHAGHPDDASMVIIEPVWQKLQK